MSSTAPHSSIGEVLSLLQVEYPDVTISKIRFLESQGLLNPERTPSGYRKFHDEDIERLRWILTQQRDHFLPLKVIKERLVAGDFADGPPEGVLPFERQLEQANEVTAPVAVPVVSESTGSAGDAVAVSDTPAQSAAAPGQTDSPLADSSSSKVDGVPSSIAPSSTPHADDPPLRASSTPERTKKKPRSNDRARAVSSLVEGPGVAASDPEPAAPRGRKRHPTGHTKGDPTPEPSGVEDPAPPPVTLTLEELCVQSGLTPAAVADLERFDLLKPRSMGPVEYYDDDALIVARLAAGFGRFGIEPRHLRMYKVSAEREAGLFEQLIPPLLKQRRAAAREQAVEMLEELAELADDLRAVMVRVSLQEYLGQS